MKESEKLDDDDNEMGYLMDGSNLFEGGLAWFDFTSSTMIFFWLSKISLRDVSLIETISMESV